MSNVKTYRNGNYSVDINLDNGTKIRYNNFDYFEPEKPESIDLKITNCCYGANGVLCSMCHEDSNPNGKHGDIMNLKFIDTMLPYSEVAIGGGDTLTHPDLIPFLKKLKERNLIANMTVNQWSFMHNQIPIGMMIQDGLIHGLGVSLNKPDDEFIDTIKKYPNAVIHCINGLVTEEQLKNLSYHNLKILILGYKTFRRGEKLYEQQSEKIESLKSSLYSLLPNIVNDGWFKVVSFDNLAIEQLDVKRLMSNDEWSHMYMGDDGKFTMYIDAVNMEYTKSSISTERWPIEDDIKTMFDHVREA